MPVPEHAHAAALRDRAFDMPDRLAFACDGESLTWGELYAAASAVAAGLEARGVAPGDRVALLLPAGLAFVTAFCGATLAGSAPFAISPGVAPVTALSRAARGRPAVVVTTERLITSLTPLADSRGLELAAIEALASATGAMPRELPRVDREAPFFLQLTSGTTGEPRFAMLSQRAIAEWRKQAAGILEVRPDDVLAGWVPPWHITGLLRFIVLPAYSGTQCHLVEPLVRNLGSWLETAARVRATYTSAPDFALRTATRAAEGREIDLSSLRLLTSGGEAVRHSTILDFERRFDLGGIVRPGYGLAESSLAVTMMRPGEPLRVDAGGHVSCGRALPGVELRIVGEGGEESAPGAPGEIHVRSGALFSGYFEAPAGDTVLVEDGWLATGDWGRLDDDDHLFVIGRRRVLLKHGGATYAPRELEEAAERVPGIAAAAAVSLARANGGRDAFYRQGAVLVVEQSARAESPAATARGAAQAIRHDIGLLPAEVVVVVPGTLPRTESGKLRHLELRRLLASGGIPAASVLHGRIDGWRE
jgi:fatty-acyl-CoA synthase